MKKLHIPVEKLAALRDLLVKHRDEVVANKTAASKGPSPEIVKKAEAIVDTMIKHGEMYAKDREDAVEKLSSLDGTQAYFQHVLGLYRDQVKKAAAPEKKAGDKPQPILGHTREKTANDKGKPVKTGGQKVAEAHDAFGDRVIAAAKGIKG